jgi:hypothetical protein
MARIKADVATSGKPVGRPGTVQKVARTMALPVTVKSGGSTTP